VIVRGNDVVGEGFHNYDEKDHAEVVALRAAGTLARGATAYITLEPCSHRGRTGPCTNALIAAGIVRVVVATLDPNPLVNGGGVERLKAAGVRVTVGVLQPEARKLNDAFARFIRTGLPLVTLKAGLSLDGRIAPAPGLHPSGEPYWITGEESRAEVHRMRHASDAILLGINSALTDDPLLTDRSERPRRRPLMRVVLDSRLRLPLDSRLVCSAADDLMVFCTRKCARENQAAVMALEDRGVQVVEAGIEGRVPLRDVLKELAERKFLSVLIEGGSTLNTEALRQDIVDRVSLFYAPKVMGEEAVPFIQDLGERKIELKKIEVTQFAEDVLLQGVLHHPWEE
jgi:diaminohydroxyphosphoribosylaminopyrimidine deaminase / 5-amino-6-(5-phosphoribosylamino)uracil reductase